MYQPPQSTTRDRRSAPPVTASLAFLVLTVGAVGVVYAITTAPALVAAFATGAVTALVGTTVLLSQDASETTETLSDPQPLRR